MTRHESKLPAVMALALLCASCGTRPERIVLAADAAASGAVPSGASVIQVPTAERRAIAILHFDNATGDAALDWLQRGLTDMIETDLSQSPYLLVLNPGRVDDILARAGKTAADLTRDARAAEAASEAKIETLLTGKYRYAAGKLVIDAELREVRTGRTHSAETIEGESLEQVFQMAGELSRRVRDRLRDPDATVAVAKPDSEIKVSDMTESIEAYRHYSRALELQQQLLGPEASIELEKAIAVDPTFAAAYVRLSHDCLQNDKTEASRAYLEKARTYASKLSPSDEILLRLVDAQIQGDFNRIWELRDELLRRAPFDTAARMQVANLLFSLGDDERAREELEALLELDPTRKTAYNMLGYLYARRGDFHTALAHLERYRDLTPNEPNANDSIGETLMLSGQLEEAIPHFRRALERWPTFYNSSWRLTEIYAELGDLERALEYADRVIATVPESMRDDFRVRRPSLLWRFGHLVEANEEVERLIRERPDLASASYLKSVMLAASGDLAAAAAVRRDFCSRNAGLGGAARWERKVAVSIIYYCAEAKVDPKSVLAMIDVAKSRDQSGAVQRLFDLWATSLALDAGDVPAAIQRLEAASRGTGVESLLVSNRARRSEGWSHVVNAIQHLPLADPPDRPIARRVELAAERVGLPTSKLMARLLDLQYHARYGRTEALASSYRELGMAPSDRFLAIGPYPNTPGFDRVFPPEAGLARGTADADAKLAWRTADDGIHDGFVDLKEVYGRSPYQLAYAAVDLISPREQVVQIRLGADLSCKLWLGSDLVWKAYRSEDKVAGIDEDIVQVVLHAGANPLLIKVTNANADWGFYLRVTDEAGKGIPDLEFRRPAAP